MRRLLVLDIVGLTPALLPHAPHLSRLAARGGLRPLCTVLPALTCPVQSTFLTGLAPAGHGAVGNGWYDRNLAEVQFWKQSNHLVHGEKVWQAAKRKNAAFTCAKLFWWYNMYAEVDIAVTPRPIYTADGRKIPDIHTRPAGLRDELTQGLGRFPLFNFWGPGADLRSSRWIARCAAQVEQRFRPSLTLVYLPHLDYDLQRFGPDDPRVPAQVAAVDALAGELIEAAERAGSRVIVLSEYGITPVRGAVPINRALREAGLLTVREELGRELLDAGASPAFAVADHQVAHVYVQRPEQRDEVCRLIAGLPGVERVEDGLGHARAGELLAVSAADRWFSYGWWRDDDRAPDFARTVEIHRKPGYDPLELFLDPRLTWPRLAVGWRLARKALGLRTLMDVIPLDDRLVRGSHGRPTDSAADGPLFITSDPALCPAGPVAATAVKGIMLEHLFDGE